ncbi:MAG: PEP-CTERM sorting domain-containing protein [Sedimentisphaerales bacterium]|nr:PEP-CTERM sorting domain-containing protein [Sedimentisphaerales bacterium]
MKNRSVTKTGIIKLITLLIVSIPTIAHSSMCYGVGAKDSRGIYEVDFTAGTVNLLFATPEIGWLGATDGDSDHPDTFYATSYSQNALFRVDVVNKTYTQVGNYGGYYINGLAYDEKNDVMYGTDYVNLYTIDIEQGSPTEGQATFIGACGVQGPAWALDYDTSIDELVAMSRLSGSTITYHIDRATGNATYIGETSYQRVTDVWYDEEVSKLFAISNDPYDTGIGELLEVDPLTGATTHISDTIENIIGLGAPIPEPLTVAIFSLGGMAAIRRRKK